MGENTVDKEKILEMSRKQNKDQDLYALQIAKLGESISLITIVIFCTLIFVLNIFAGNGFKMELYTPVAIFNAVQYTIKYKMSEENKKTNKFAMICWTIAAAIGVFGSIAEIFIK